MQHDHHDHHAGAPMMELMHKPAGGHFRKNVMQTAISFSRGWSIVDGQENACERLNQKQENRDASKNLMPSAGCRNILIHEVVNRGYKARPVLQPVEQPFQSDSSSGP